MWDFGAGYGPIAPATLAALWQDPSTGASYSSNPHLTTMLIAQQPGSYYFPAIYSGLAPSSNVSSVPVNNLIWTYAAGDAQVEVLDQDNWTKLTLLDPQPLINFSPTPSVTPASSPFIIAGTSSLGSLPVYVQTSFVGRQRHTTAAATNGTTISLSPYTVDTDEVYVFVGYGTTKQQLLSSATDYTVDQFGNFTPITLAAGGTTVDIFFEEEFPAYQCSIDQINWSPLLMMDTARPYPDNATSFPPIAWSTNSQGLPALPITDEIGTPTGLYIEIGPAVPTQTYLLEASSQASPNTVGATASLEIDFAQLSYLTVIQVTPFTTFPMVLTKVEIQGITTNTRQTVWAGSLPISQPTAIRLDQQLGTNPLVSKVFLTFYQPNYSLKQQTVTPPDALRLDVMSQLQAVLPFNVRNVLPPPAVVYTGAQYEFGIANVSGECWATVPGVFVSGPNRFEGCPSVVRFDADYSNTQGDPAINVTPIVGATHGVLGLNTVRAESAGGRSISSLHGLPIEITPSLPVDFYICFQAFSAEGTVVAQNLSGYHITSAIGACFPFKYVALPTTLVPSQIDHVDFYIKIVHRTLTTVVQRYMLQVIGQ